MGFTVLSYLGGIGALPNYFEVRRALCVFYPNCTAQRQKSICLSRRLKQSARIAVFRDFLVRKIHELENKIVTT